MRIGVLAWKLSGVQSGAHVAHLETAEALAELGHRIQYAALRGETVTRFGRRVRVGAMEVRRVARWADVVFVRDDQKTGRVLSQVGTTRVVYAAHSPAGAPSALGLRLPEDTTVVWASRAAFEAACRLNGPQSGVVIEGYPVRFQRTTPGECITLVNLSERKGGPLFWELAERMPDRPFLGVKSWGEQVIPDRIPPNVTLIDRTDDVLGEVYARTRILLVPSADPGTIASEKLPTWGEAWNRVSVEASACGIPTIAHPSGGVLASIGHAATYVDRDDVDGWARAIAELDDPEAMAAAQARCAARVREIEADRADIVRAFEAVLYGRVEVAA